MANSGFYPRGTQKEIDKGYCEVAKFQKAGDREVAVMTNDVTNATNILDVAAETITLAAGAQGTTGTTATDKAPIYNAVGVQIGSLADTSFAFVTGTVLTTEIVFDYKLSDAEQLAAMANGDFAIDYRVGKILYKKDTAGVSDTADYKSRQTNIEVTGPSSVSLGSVKIENGANTDKALVTDANTARAVTDHVLAVQPIDAAGNVMVAQDLTDTKTAVELIDDGIGTDGGAEVAKAMAIGGNDGANFQVVKVNSDGELMVNLETSDIEIGAVEIKNASTDDRVMVTDADTARAASDHVLAVQHIDAAGGVMAAADLTAVKTAVEIMDDWDETDRCKSNPIVGQAGVAGGTGVLGATVQRVTVATDDTVATDLTAIKTAVEILDDIVLEEDTVHVSGDKGVMPLAVRQDVASALAADGDYIPLTTTSSGELRVSASVGTSYAEDTQHNSGDDGTQMLTVRNDTVGTLCDTDGDYAVLQVNADGAAYTSVSHLNATAINVNGGAIDAGTQTMTLATDDPAVVDLAAIELLNTDIKTAVEIMDDWDESDRCKSNPIVGQAGVAAGAGAVGATVQRTTLASDDPAVSKLEEMAGGTTALFDADGDNTAQVCKAAAGTLYNVDVINPNAAAAYVQLFNVAAGGVTVGVTAPNYVLFVPPQGAASIIYSTPLGFGTAITYACTTTATGGVDPTAGLTVSMAYK